MTTKANLTFGYHAKWLEFGFIDETFLRQQVDVCTVSQDQHTEHYRYAAFRSILKMRYELTDNEFEQYLELAGLDEDGFITSAALKDLAEWPGLTEEQFQQLCGHPLFANAYLGRVLDRGRRKRGEI